MAQLSLRLPPYLGMIKKFTVQCSETCNSHTKLLKIDFVVCGTYKFLHFFNLSYRNTFDSFWIYDYDKLPIQTTDFDNYEILQDVFFKLNETYVLHRNYDISK